MSLSADVCASKADQFLISGCKPISRCSREMMLDQNKQFNTVSDGYPFRSKTIQSRPLFTA
jgi:hypothetical protein